MASKIFVAIDGSDISEVAFTEAVRLFNSDETEFIVCHVIPAVMDIPITGRAGYCAGLDNELTDPKLQEIQKNMMVKKIKKLGDSKGVDVEPVVLFGDPRTEIIEQAEKTGADIIVLGSMGKGFAERLLIGSVSNYVVTHSRISTFVFRP